MSRIIKISLILAIFFLFISHSGFILAQTNTNDEIKRINQEIQDKRNRIRQIQSNQERYSQMIQEKNNEQASLQNELAIMDNRIAKAQMDIENVQTEIDRTNLEIKKTNIEIDEKTAQIAKEKDRIDHILRIMYKNDDVNSLEILLLNNSFSEFLNQVKYLEDINTQIKDSLNLVTANKKELEAEMDLLGKKNNDLTALKKDMEDKKSALSSEKDNKLTLLDQTNMSEVQFRNLLAQAKQEQVEASVDITNLEKTVRAKMSKISDKKLEFNDKGFIWPVPKNTITAYFHDPDYPFRYIFEHPAVDIRTPQGTNIRAAASGYVARAKNGGMAYSYIMLVHGDAMSTVYGHVSKLFVKEDEFVMQGQVIGLSGGAPGTPGAGPLTTGSHLHFEVRQNGIPVNPLDYLP